MITTNRKYRMFVYLYECLCFLLFDDDGGGGDGVGG